MGLEIPVPLGPLPPFPFWLVVVETLAFSTSTVFGVIDLEVWPM